MHTFTWTEDTKFHHNADFTGDVVIVTEGKERAIVPFAALQGLVAEYLRREMIQALEDASPEGILGHRAWVQRLVNRET